MQRSMVKVQIAKCKVQVMQSVKWEENVESVKGKVQSTNSASDQYKVQNAKRKVQSAKDQVQSAKNKE